VPPYTRGSVSLSRLSRLVFLPKECNNPALQLYDLDTSKMRVLSYPGIDGKALGSGVRRVLQRGRVIRRHQPSHGRTLVLPGHCHVTVSITTSLPHHCQGTATSLPRHCQQCHISATSVPCNCHVTATSLLQRRRLFHRHQPPHGWALQNSSCIERGAFESGGGICLVCELGKFK